MSNPATPLNDPPVLIYHLSQWIDTEVLAEAVVEQLMAALGRVPTENECRNAWCLFLEDLHSNLGSISRRFVPPDGPPWSYQGGDNP